MVLLCTMVAGADRSYGAAIAPSQNPPRFLFIIEKSEATRALSLDLPQTTFDLVYRGANGYLPDGGVFEIWIFGEETIFRGLPPQMLTPGNQLPLASRASAYVRTTQSGGVADVPKLVEHVRGASELGMELTIILVTAPDTRLTGTARDVEINGLLDAQVEAQRAAGRPFIISIRVQDGVLAASTVSDSPFTMTMPPMPPSQLTPEEREQRIAAARQARHEREKPATPPETVTVAAAAPVAPRRNLDIPDEQREGAIILRGNPRAAQALPPATAATATTEPAPTAPVSVSTPTPPGTPEPAGPADSATPAASLPARTDSPDPAGAPATVSGSPPGEPAGSPGVRPTNVIPQPAVAVPARTWLTAGGLFVAGLCFFVVAALLTWVLMRRARAAAGPSYITRSIEHRRD